MTNEEHNTPKISPPSQGGAGGESVGAGGESSSMLEAFKTFFKIGIVTFGGGYAMIPMIEEEVVNKHHWVKKEELLDLIAIAQSCPGVFAINISTFSGYTLNKRKGALTQY